MDWKSNDGEVSKKLKGGTLEEQSILGKEEESVYTTGVSPQSRIPRQPQLQPLHQSLPRAPLPASYPTVFLGNHVINGAPNTTLIHPSPPTPSLSLKIPAPHQNEHPNESSSILYGAGGHPIQFIPSPTEYTSFEALYSQNPPYHLEDDEDEVTLYPDDLNPDYHASSYPETVEQYSTISSSHSHSTPLPAFRVAHSYPPPLLPGHADLPPRKRSYTKSLSNGSQITGEIVVGTSPFSSLSSGVEGGIGPFGVGTGNGLAKQQKWRRHTKVFGGGVCKACEEGASGSNGAVAASRRATGGVEGAVEVAGQGVGGEDWRRGSA